MKRAPRAKMGTGVSIRDLEKAMGRKADKVSDYVFDPETGAWTRNITFNLTPLPRIRRGRKHGK